MSMEFEARKILRNPSNARSRKKFPSCTTQNTLIKSIIALPNVLDYTSMGVRVWRVLKNLDKNSVISFQNSLISLMMIELLVGDELWKWTGIVLTNDKMTNLLMKLSHLKRKTLLGSCVWFLSSFRIQNFQDITFISIEAAYQVCKRVRSSDQIFKLFPQPLNSKTWFC